VIAGYRSAAELRKKAIEYFTTTASVGPEFAACLSTKGEESPERLGPEQALAVSRGGTPHRVCPAGCATYLGFRSYDHMLKALRSAGGAWAEALEWIESTIERFLCAVAFDPEAKNSQGVKMALATVRGWYDRQQTDFPAVSKAMVSATIAVIKKYVPLDDQDTALKEYLTSVETFSKAAA